MTRSSFDHHMPRAFATTCWSVVLTAGRIKGTEAEAALAALCETYWYPLYGYARRQSYPSQDARDLVQGFFAKLVEKEYLHAVDQQKGRFRTFLLTAFRRFISNERAAQRALKRGGGHEIVSINVDDAEIRYAREPADHLTPEQFFERRWAVALLDRVVDQLQQKYAEREQSEFFDLCWVFLTEATDRVRYADVANRLAISEAAVKVGVYRMRQRYGETLLQELGRTVGEASDVEEEFRHLLAAVQYVS